jgi:hypothetical protein
MATYLNRNMLESPVYGERLFHSRTDHKGPDGEQRYGRALSLTTVLNGDGWSKPRLYHFTSGKETQYPWILEAGWAPGPVWVWKDVENLAPTGIRSPNRPFHNELLYRQLHFSPVFGIKCAINWNKSYLSKLISHHLQNFHCFVRSFQIQYFIFRTLHLSCKILTILCDKSIFKCAVPAQMI